MSLFRQLWLAVAISTALAFAGSFAVSMLTARNYLEQQLQTKNADNASALALSLSQQDKDPVTVDLFVAALFDSGQYELVRVADPFGKTVAERAAPPPTGDAPEWFVRLIPIRPQPGTAKISDGWRQFGSITLVSHSRFAYRELWRGVFELLGWFAAAGLVSGALGTLILRRLHRPLGAVVAQAQAITERRFITIAEPAVPELHQLAKAMNATVGRLKAMFDEEATRLEAVRREANCDALTGVANRGHFLARLHEALGNEDSTGGALILVRIADLAGINQRLGRGATDELIRRVGTAVSGCAQRHPEGLAARLNGADFAVLLSRRDGARDIAQELLQALVLAAEPYVQTGPSAWLGVAGFGRGIEAGALMAQADAALAAAQAEGCNAVREITASIEEDVPKCAAEWSHLIHRALEQRWVRLISFPVADLSGRLIHRECPLRLMFDEHGEWLPAGRFLPVAERLGLTPQLDLAAVRLGLEHLAREPALPGLAINLSASSLQGEAFRRELRTLVQQHAAAAGRLWLEVAEAGAFMHLTAFRAFCAEFAGSVCRIGLEHFGRQFSQVGQLHDLGLDYLKVDASFVRGLETNAGNQAFLKGLCGIAHAIGLKVFAEGVVSEAELQALAQAGFDGATGPAVKDAAA